MESPWDNRAIIQAAYNRQQGAAHQGKNHHLLVMNPPRRRLPAVQPPT
jgi:hypothetical protein